MEALLHDRHGRNKKEVPSISCDLKESGQIHTSKQSHPNLLQSGRTSELDRETHSLSRSERQKEPNLVTVID